MNLDLNTEQNILKNSARDFLQSRCPSALVREARNAEEPFPRQLWDGMAEMGWMSLAIDEAHDGLGGSLADLNVLIEQMGAACVPVPYFTTVVVCASAIQRSAATALKEALLPRIAAGELVATLALIEPENAYGLDNIQTTAAASGDGFVINGTKLFVEYAEGADYFLTVAQSESDGLVVSMIDARSDGISLTPMPTLDYSKQCEVIFADVNVPAANVLATGDAAQTLMLAVEDFAATAKCAEMVGAMQSVLDVSIEYVKVRTQFGQPVGGFQSIQHHLANMAVDMDSARYLSGLAAYKISQGEPASREVSMAKSFVSRVAVRVAKLGHQVHGAIAFCDEHDMHLWLRKVQSASMAFGDSDYHLEKVAQEIGL